MISVLREFENAISGVQNLNAIHDHLLNDLHLNVAASEILRCQLVYTVSAMDRYFHEIVRVGFLEEYNGVRIKTDSYSKWSFSNKKLAEIVRFSNPSFVPSSYVETPDYVIESDVREKNGVLAFQQPDKIKEALSLIWNYPNKIAEIAKKMAFEPTRSENDRKKLLEQKIKLISIRRNQIVHEGDIDPLTTNKRDILKSDVLDCIEFINSFVHAIHTLITDSSCYISS